MVRELYAKSCRRKRTADLNIFIFFRNAVFLLLYHLFVTVINYLVLFYVIFVIFSVLPAEKCEDSCIVSDSRSANYRRVFQCKHCACGSTLTDSWGRKFSGLIYIRCGCMVYSTLHGENNFSTSGAGVISCNALVQSAIVDRHHRHLKRPGPVHRVSWTARLHLHAVLQPRDFRFRSTDRVAYEPGTWPDGRHDFRLAIFNCRSRFTPHASLSGCRNEVLSEY